MAVVNVNSTPIANAVATPQVLNSANLVKGNLSESQALFTITTGDSVGSTYRLFRMRSADRVSQIRLYTPDMGTTTAFDVGLYDPTTAANGGTVVDADFFASAVVVNAGALNGSDLTFEAAAAGGLIANAEKRIWEALGLTTDPHKEYDVTLTLTGACDGTGTGLLRLAYVTGQ